MHGDIRLITRNFLSILLLLFTVFRVSFAGDITPAGCRLQRTWQPGAIAKFYEYPLYDIVDYNSPDFSSTGFLDSSKYPYVGEVKGINNFNWDSGPSGSVSPFGFTGVPTSNFMMVLTGYFIAPMTGVYGMNLKVADYFAFFIGAGRAFDCCKQTASFSSDDALFSLTISGGGELGANSHKVYLERGVAYPVRAIYVNAEGQGVLEMSVRMPGGLIISDFAGAIFSDGDGGYDEELCSDITVSHPYTTIFNTQYTESIQGYVGGLTAPSVVRTVTETQWYNADDGQVNIITVVY